MASRDQGGGEVVTRIKDKHRERERERERECVCRR